MRTALHDEILSGPAAHSQTEAQTRMELEFELASSEGADATLLWIVVDNLHRLAPEAPQRARLLRSLTELMHTLPRAGDLIARAEQNALVAFLPRSSPAAGESFARALVDAARKLVIDGATPVRAGLCIGVAAVQKDIALYFDALLSVAEEGAAVALASGGEGVVHSELYLLHQRKLERTRPKLAAPAGARGPGAHHNAQAPGSQRPTTGTNPTTPTLESRAPLTGAGALACVTDERFLAEVQRVVAHDSAAHSALVALEPKLMALAQEWARGALEKALAEQEARYTAERARYESEREQYERRLTKINQALFATEAELRAVAAAKHVETGVTSAFRNVQGLSAAAADYEAKIALLAHILEANLDLRRQLPQAGAA